MKSLREKFNVFIYTIILCMPGLLNASPLFSIGDGTNTSWADALEDGSIEAAADSLSGGAAQQFYKTQIGIFGVQSIVAATDTSIAAAGPVSDGRTEFDSLVMSWDQNNSFDQTDLVVSAWDYNYGVDPDLTGTMVHFSARAPIGVWDLSLELIDINGNTRGWFRGLPAALWTNYWINPSANGPQGPFNSFYEDAGFDLTQVITIRLNESSMGGTAFTDVDPVTGLVNPWNAWNHLSVVPVPATAWLVGLALLGLGVARRKKA